jgi:iron(III) transport system ATP-binding protein
MSDHSSISSARRRRATATFASRLSLRGLTRRYGTAVALDAVDLDVEQGEVVSLLGHSGCGKTTLLRIAAGVETPSEGTVLIDDKPVASRDIYLPPEKRNVGLMFQDYALFPHLTLLRNVMFGLTALDRKAARDEALAALTRVGLDRLKDAYPHEVSGGEQQRAALARAIVPRPGILLMDEPFSGLDSRLRDSVREETMAVLRETGATAVIVTHDPEEAMRMSDRIVLMRHGRIMQDGSAEDLYNAPESLFAARFFSELNEIPGFVKNGRLSTGVGEFDSGGLPDGTKAIVAVRPQGVVLSAGSDGEGVPGRIVSRRFLGEIDHFDVAVGGLESYLLSRRRTEQRLPAGSEVVVSFDPRDVLVFKADH